jgi:hypothetical protein
MYHRRSKEVISMSADAQRALPGPSYQPVHFLRLVYTTSPAQGEEAIQMRSLIHALGNEAAPGQSVEAAQLRGVLLELQAEIAETTATLRNLIQGSQDMSYDPLPLKSAFTVQATYKFVGKLKPRQFPPDE